MPIIRYQIRNEYGLADPELYGAADKEDPEDLLEGVAMAGLVGVLRQLGDLSEFAAEIFHDLHEEVVATASRSHALMLRVRQLEAEFPAIEKSFLSQTSHSNLAYNTGIDWHPNLQIDQNLITREDMPRFILDSYEESRGPPRLFMLDKFDIAGDGACLKRYSDPSYFKMNFAASREMEPDIQREKRSRKNKKKMQRRRNGETPESCITPHMNFKLESVFSENAPENPLIKRVKLKTRQLKENTSIGRIYMEHILEKQLSDHIHFCDNSVSKSQMNVKTIDSAELVPEVREVIMDTSTCKPFSIERNQTELHSKEELNFDQKEETVSDKKDNQILKNEKQEEVQKLPATFHKADQKELSDEADCKREGNDDAEKRTNGSLNGCISDDVASELDSYLDALTTMDSEIETDNYTNAKPEPSFFSKEYNLGSNANEQRRLITECLDSHTFRKSSSTQNSLSKGMPGHPSGDSLSSLANSTPSHGTSRALLGTFRDAETPEDETQDTNFQNNNANSEVSGNESSIDLVPKQMTTDIVSTLTESGVESSSIHTTETTVALIHSSLHSSLGDVQSATANQNIIPGNATSTENIGKCYDGEYIPPSNLDAQEAAQDPNDLLLNPVEGHKNGLEKHLEGDFHQRWEKSRSPITEDDSANPGLLSKNTEMLDSHTFIKSSSTQNSLSEGMPIHPNGDSLSSLANSTPSHGTSWAPLGMFRDAEMPENETHDTNFKINNVNCEVSGNEFSIGLVPKQMTTDIISTLTESGVESSSTCTAETSVALINSSLHSSPGDVQSATANQNIIRGSAASTEKIGKCYDGEYIPSNLDAQEAVEDPNVLLSNPVEGRKNGSEKLLEDDFHQRSEESRSPITEDDYANPGLISKNPEILSDTPLHSGVESDLNLQSQEDPSLEALVAVPCTGELSTEGIASMPSDSYSTQMHKTINLETSTSTCVEDLLLPFSVSNEEVRHGSVCQHPDVDSAEGTLSRKCPPIIPPDNNPSIAISYGLLGPAGYCVLSNEMFECEKSSTSFEADFTEDKATSPENMGSTAGNEDRDSVISPPGPFFAMVMPQESSSSDQVEFSTKNVLPNIMKVPLNASVYETGDSPVSTGDHSNLHCSVIPFKSPMELLPTERDSPCLVTEGIETDELCSATLYSQESSANYTNLQESFSSDSVSEQQKLEATETSSLKDLMNMDVQQVLCTSASQENHVVVTGPQNSESAGHTLDSSSQPDSGEHSYDWHTETFLPADDLCPCDGNKAATISLVEVENESQSINSGIDHYLGNIETSYSEYLTGADDQQASTIAFLEQEEDGVITVPGVSKSGEPTDDSFHHTDLKHPICVLCEEDPKSALSPQNSRIEDRLPEPSDNFDFESVEDAELLKANEVITFTLESQVSHLKSLLSVEACQTGSKDAFLSDDVSTESISPSKEVFTLQSSNESDEIPLQQKIGRLDFSDIQPERGPPLEQNDNKIESEPLVQETAHDSVEVVSSNKIYQLDTASTNESSLNQLEIEVDSPLQSSFGIAVCSAISNAPLASLQTFPSLGESSSTMILPQSSELPLDEDPPLPPLPPLQWRVGKLQPTSFMSSVEMAQPQNGPNHLTTLPSLDHSGGSLVMGGAGVRPLYLFSQVQELPNNSNQFGYQTLEEEGVNPFRSSALSPAVEAQQCQDDVLPEDVQLKHLHANSSFVVNHVEDRQLKHELCQEALSGDAPQSLNPFMSLLPFSDASSQQFPTAPEGEPIEQPKSSASLPTLAYSEPEHGTASMETATTHPSNPFLSSTSTEFESYQYSSGTFGVRMVQNQNFPDPLSTMAIATPYILISQGENTLDFEGVTLSTEEHGKPNGRFCSLLNRPRHPLMQAVASHDKSTLRRVSELVHPSARTVDERNSLLEQIRNKSFNLKPTTVTKPNIKGPPTNLKVSAILEKANAIRQAFVGSDEDDDGDSWSDS